MRRQILMQEVFVLQTHMNLATHLHGAYDYDRLCVPWFLIYVLFKDHEPKMSYTYIHVATIKTPPDMLDWRVHLQGK